MSYADLVRSGSPSAFWMFDEGSGSTAIDRSGNGKNGTYTSTYALNGASLLYGAESRSSLSLSATGYVSVPDDNVFSTHTSTGESWETIIQPASSITASEMLCSKYGPSNYEYFLALHTGGACFLQRYSLSGTDIGQAMSATGLIVVGSKYHIVATYDPTVPKQEVWINGALAISQTSGVTTGGGNGSEPFRIGYSGYGGAGTQYNGLMAAMAVYPRPLTSSEIKARYAAWIRGGVIY
jgi:hypothetical protein